MSNLLVFLLMFGIFFCLPLAAVGYGVYWMVLGRGKSLRQKFQSIGTLKGKTRAQITSLAGAPKIIQNGANGTSNLTWGLSGYSITLIFKNDVCEGVAGEVIGQ